jgi:hypothetical protein
MKGTTGGYYMPKKKLSPEAVATKAKQVAKQKKAKDAFLKFRANTPFLLGSQPDRWRN